MTRSRALWLALSSTATVAAAAALFACSQTPTSVPIRTFERAQKVDVVCLRVFGEGAPAPLKQEECAPVPPDVNGGNLQNQLFALVTQTSRGEVAVVDLSAGAIIDQSHAVPGLNFLPVGANPTDIAATPDGRMIFVASAEPNKFAIYGIPGHRILGDAAERRDPEGAVTLSSWPVCALPQRPGSLTVVPRRPTPGVTADAGASPAAPGTELPYELVAVLPGDRTSPAKIVTLDPRPFLRGSPRRAANGDVIDDLGPGATLAPGQLAPCPITAAIELTGEDAVPATFRPGARWPDGIEWVDGGVDLSCATPPKSPSCGLPSCQCQVALGIDGGVDADGGAASACEADGGAGEADAPLDLGPLDPPRPIAIARDDQTLYVADDGVPLIHVIDLSNPGAPRELPPLVVSSIVDPSRTVSIRDLAVSPPTHDYKRFLYAVDRKDGSIAVFDVTDPASVDRAPMRRPHAELNPFQSPDRISFTAPVVSVAFARNDFPIVRIDGVPVSNAPTGILCNPNPNLDANRSQPNGLQYRASSVSVDVGLGPRPTLGRLRGVFAFATLSNGDIVAIDVDDWDAPCRRPARLAGPSTDPTVEPSGVLAVVQPEAAPGDFDPYHAPVVVPETVSQEIFFPVSAPHRARSNYLLRDDVSTGKHVPYLSAIPTITSTNETTPSLSGQGSEATPRLRPTAAFPGAAAPSLDPSAGGIGVRFSLDVPDVHIDQDWAVTYEGMLPGFEGIPATLSTNDGYASLILAQPQAAFCAKGVEDWNTGGDRARAVTAALAAAGRAGFVDPPIERRMFDYVQVADELLASNDPFWRQSDLAEPNGCWDDSLLPQSNDPAQIEVAARNRHEVCSSVFGTTADPSRSRDFPILEAYDDRLVLGRYTPIDAQRPNAPRDVVYTDPSNAPTLKLLRCCFHSQTKFNVRAGSQWLAVGSTVGMLSHVVRADGGRCVASCEPHKALLNARAPALPYDASGADFAPFRDSALALRNPAFSFFVQNGYTQGTAGAVAVDAPPARNVTYRFQTRGQFQPLVISLAASTTSVNPQSMRFIESLGQIAVVDGSSQGLVLIDLAGVGIARAPYF